MVCFILTLTNLINCHSLYRNVFLFLDGSGRWNEHFPSLFKLICEPQYFGLSLYNCRHGDSCICKLAPS